MNRTMAMVLMLVLAACSQEAAAQEGAKAKAKSPQKGKKAAPAPPGPDLSACPDGSALGCLKRAIDHYVGSNGAKWDVTQAAVLYGLACAGGELRACVNLGLQYAEGDGVPQDHARARELHTRACDGGDLEGCSGLGFLYDKGLGVPKDGAKARALYRRACEGGEPEACFKLGLVYANGVDVAQDHGKAQVLYTRACDSGHPTACRNLGRLYADGLEMFTTVERIDLQSRIRSRLDTSYTNFVAASQSVKDSLRASAKADADLAAMWCEIFLGFLAPGMSRGLAQIADRLPQASSTMAYRVALMSLNENATKDVFKSAVKVGSQSLKANSIKLFGEVQDEEFVRQLNYSAALARDQISEGLIKKTDAELAMLHAAFDPAFITEEIYRVQIKELLDKYKTEVQLVQEFELNSPYKLGNTNDFWLVQMDAYGRKRLAIIALRYHRRVWRHDGFVRHADYIPVNEPFLWAWVSPELEGMVVRRFKQWGHEIHEGFPPGLLKGRLPNPDTELEVGRPGGNFIKQVLLGEPTPQP